MNSEVLIKFVGDTSSVNSSVKGLDSSFGKLTKSITLGNLASKAITTSLGLLQQNLDGAISRVDTLNNFPIVMQNLGISAKDSEEAINTLSDKLQGLPTSLDEAASAVKIFTSANNDVKASTDIYLAVNNALIAGGANAQVQASAMEQLSQAYAKGKPDAMEWRSMLTAMPAQLKQVASAMGYTSTAVGGDLYEAIQKGQVSMNDFMNTFIKLNKEGTGSFASFEKQAKGATGGIQTSIKNMKTAFVRGVGNIIKSVDESLKSVGGLSGVISKLGEIGENVFSNLGPVISTIIPPLMQIAQAIMPSLQSVLSMLMPTLTNITQTIMPIIVQLINTLLPPLMQIVQMLLPPLLQIINSLLPLLKPIADMIKPIITLIMAIISPLMEIINAILPPVIDLLSVILQTILPPLNYAIGALAEALRVAIQISMNLLRPFLDYIKNTITTTRNILSGLIDFIKNVFTGNWKGAWQSVKDIFKSIMKGLGGVLKTPLNSVISMVNLFIKGLNKIKIPSWVPGVGGKGINIPVIPKLATGTNYVPDDMLAMIHEGEAVVPKKFNPYANGMSANVTSSMRNSFGRNGINNIQVYIEQDPLGQMVKTIKTYSGGSPNDYNYGAGF